MTYLCEDCAKKDNKESVMKIGATKKFPDGKINANDEGELRIAITIENGVIMVYFGKSISWLGFDTETARKFGETLIKRSEEIREDICQKN